MNRKLITYGKVFRFCGLHWAARLIEPASNVRVTYTHGVASRDLDNFDRIVQYLRQERTLISPDIFLSLYDGGQPLAGRLLLMTFDDGLLSSYQAARHVLGRYGIRAIFFVPTAVLDLRTDDQMRRFAAERIHEGSCDPASLAPEDYQFLSPDHLAELASDGHMICPHTHSHARLDNITDGLAAEREIVRPKRLLEDLLRRKVRAFSFPRGTERQAGRYAYDCIRQHYEFCFTALNGVNAAQTDPHQLHRDCLPPEAPLLYVRMVMQGTYDCYYRLKGLRLRKLTEPLRARREGGQGQEPPSGQIPAKSGLED